MARGGSDERAAIGSRSLLFGPRDGEKVAVRPQTEGKPEWFELRRPAVGELELRIRDLAGELFGGFSEVEVQRFLSNESPDGSRQLNAWSDEVDLRFVLDGVAKRIGQLAPTPAAVGVAQRHVKLSASQLELVLDWLRTRG